MKPAAKMGPWRDRTWAGSFRAAWTGLVTAWRLGRNFRVQVAAGYAALVLAAWLRPAGVGVAAIALTVGLVLAAEILNTAVEVLVDLVTSEYHPLARSAKDLAAGAVLLTAVTALVVAGWVFLPHLAEIPSVVEAHWRRAPAVSGGLGAVLAILVLAAARGMARGAADNRTPAPSGAVPPAPAPHAPENPPRAGRPPRV